MQSPLAKAKRSTACSCLLKTNKKRTPALFFADSCLKPLTWYNNLLIIENF
jgi:hypothetical protein